MKLRQTDVGVAAENGSALLLAENLKDRTTYEELATYEADIFVVVAYGFCCHRRFWTYPNSDVNGHASLLPRWRGAALIQRAIEAGDRRQASAQC